MIGFLRGIVHSFANNYVLLDVNNVGYRINFFHPDKLHVGQEILIYTYQNVREDEVTLFGFLSLVEYELFVKLISVKGLGPKIASGILAIVTPEKLIEAIENGDVALMKTMPGIGAKTASQIILDLKGKLVVSQQDKEDDARLQDVSEALKQLGYKPSEIKPVLKQLANEDLTLPQYIKKALVLLKGR